MPRKPQPQPQPQPAGPLELRLGDTLIHYHVVRSVRRKRTIEISLDPVKGVRVAAPMRASDARIEEVVRSRAAWIIKTTSTAARPKPKRYLDGERFWYLGEELVLRVVPTATHHAQIALKDVYLVAAVPLEWSEDSEAAVRLALLTWFGRRALERLGVAVERWAAAMGLKPKQVLVRDQKTLWGSCAFDGTLRFNWRSVQVPPALMDYVVVHELAHMKVRSHSPRFREEVGRYIPDHLERRRALREASPALGC